MLSSSTLGNKKAKKNNGIPSLMLNRWLPAPFCTSCYLLKWFRLKIFWRQSHCLSGLADSCRFCLATYMWDMWTQERWFGKDAVWIRNWIRKTASCLVIPSVVSNTLDQFLILKTDGLPVCDNHGLSLQTLWFQWAKKNAEDANPAWDKKHRTTCALHLTQLAMTRSLAFQNQTIRKLNKWRSFTPQTGSTPLKPHKKTR